MRWGVLSGFLVVGPFDLFQCPDQVLHGSLSVGSCNCDSPWTEDEAAQPLRRFRAMVRKAVSL
jgi:hypothetical protein